MTYFIQYVVDAGHLHHSIGSPVALFAFEGYSKDEVTQVANYHLKRLIKKSKYPVDAVSTCIETTIENIQNMDKEFKNSSLIKKLKIKEFKKLTGLEDYIIQSSRTRPQLGVNRQRGVKVDLDVLHYNMGFVTEFGELVDIFKRNIAYGELDDEVHALEEYGDIWWYMGCLVLHLIEQKHPHSNHTTLKEFEVCFNEELDDFSMTYEGKFIAIEALMRESGNLMCGDNTISYTMAFITKVMMELYPNFDMMKALQNNVDKLKVRYEDGFTAEEAITRDLESERIQLENEGTNPLSGLDNLNAVL